MVFEQPFIASSIRESRRARRVILKITAKGLEITVPFGFDHSLLPDIIQKRRTWIEKSIRKMTGRLENAKKEIFPPEHVYLGALKEQCTLVYRPTKDRCVYLEDHGNRHITVSGSVKNETAVKEVLKKWLKIKGEQHIPSWLADESRRTGLGYGRVQVRNQKSRWGSCSTSGCISLNCKLLFLKPETVRYVLVHELCHTVHHNHSPRFWNLVARFDPAFNSRRLELKQAGQSVPGWAE